MRWAILVLLAACEHKAPPRQQAAPPPPPASERAAVAAPAAPALPAQGSAAKQEVTPECVEVGKHVAEVFIASASDAAQKGVYEQERTRIVRSTAEVCTNQAWSADAMGCYRAAKTPADLKVCEQAHVAQPTPRAPEIRPKGAP
jgi:hypothetical protein